MAAGVRVAITLACTECKRRNYQSKKSKRNTPDRRRVPEVLPLVRYAHACTGRPASPMARETRRQRRDARRAAGGERARAAARRARASTAAPVAADGPVEAHAEPRGRRSAARSSASRAPSCARSSGRTARQVSQGTVVVIIACAIVGAYLWGLDQILRRLVQNVFI